MRAGAILLAVIASLPTAILGVRAIAITAPQFSDPCFEWGSGNGNSGAFSGSLRAGDPCRSRGGTSETKRQAVARMLLIPGGMLAAIVLGIFGVVRPRLVFAVAGAVVMFLESIALAMGMSIGLLATALAGGAFLLAGRMAAAHR